MLKGQTIKVEVKAARHRQLCTTPAYHATDSKKETRHRRSPSVKNAPVKRVYSIFCWARDWSQITEGDRQEQRISVPRRGSLRLCQWSSSRLALRTQPVMDGGGERRRDC